MTTSESGESTRPHGFCWFFGRIGLWLRPHRLLADRAIVPRHATMLLVAGPALMALAMAAGVSAVARDWLCARLSASPPAFPTVSSFP